MVRFFLGAVLWLAVSIPGMGAEMGVREWFDMAADATAGRHRREYAAQHLIMLADSSASILIGELKNVESGLRRQVAAKLLGEIAPPDAERALLEAAFGDEYFLAEAARGALARLYSKLSDADLYSLLTRGVRERYGVPEGGGSDDWLALSLRLAENRGGFKALVMGGLALKREGSGEVLPQPLQWQVWEALLDGDRDLRLAAVRVLPVVGSPEAVERLAALLYVETDPAVLIAGLRVMGMMRPPGYGEVVERLAGHGDARVAVEALGVLSDMGYPLTMVPAVRGGRAVAAYVVHPSTPVRRRAVELLIGSRNPAALEYLETALRDRVGGVRALAARGLGEMGLTVGVGSLMPMLRDGRPEVRCEVAVALSRLGVVGVASGVLEDLVGGEGPFRVSAAEALGRIGDRRAVPGLVGVLLSGEGGDGLGFAVIEALGRLGDGGAGGVLYGVMVGGDVVMGGYARRALASIYGEDPGEDETGWPDWAKRHGIPTNR